MSSKDKFGDKEKTGFMNFIWNPDAKEFLGRTGSSWFKIVVFYIIFYICLAAFWALMLLIFYQTLDERVPKFQLDESRIGQNPGLGFRPRPPSDKVDSTLISFKNGNEEKDWKHWSSDLEKFLDDYQKDSKTTSDTGSHIQTCSYGKGADEGKFCMFDVKEIKNNCTKENDFGYKRGDPCVLVKLNKIFNWKPVAYDTKELSENKDIPAVIKDQYPSRQDVEQLVFITCDGESAADRENIGPVDYYPSQGIPFKYFPYTNQPGYLSPFVFVHFAKPNPGILINIECKAWAKNIKHNRMDREGSVHFELLMDGF